MMTKDYTAQLDAAIKEGIGQDTIIQIIRITITHIGPEVTWDHFESYLASKIPEDDEIFDNLHALVFAQFQDLEILEEGIDSGLIKLSFKKKQTTQAFHAFTQHAFPIINSEYPQINDNEIILTDDQHFFCRRGTMLKTAELPADFLNDYFLKTLRADEYDFSDKFIKGLFPNPHGARRLQNLRPKGRLPCTILGDGSVISRTERTVFPTTKKEGFTQIQSCTYLDKQALTPAFGFDRDRNPKLYGLLTHRHDLIINRMLVEDGGTVSRPFDQETTRPDSRSSRLRSSSNPLLFHSNEYEKFKSVNSRLRKKKHKTNEVLARLHFNIFRGMICICANDLEARLLAYDFLEEILENYHEHAKSKGIAFNRKYKIPVVFYLKKPEAKNSISSITKGLGHQSHHKIFLYTRRMRKQDIERANSYYRIDSMRIACYTSKNYEFLLGLDSMSSSVLLEPTNNGAPLALEMLRNGYTRMLLRLLRPSRKNTAHHANDSLSLKEIVFDDLIASEHLIKNDIAISYLVIAEEFSIANKLIKATNSNIDELIIEETIDDKIQQTKLEEYILYRGNPRHFDFLGLDKMLVKAADKDYWVPIRLCLKEFSNIHADTLHLLLTGACWRRKPFNEPNIVFLLKKTKVSARAVQVAFDDAKTSLDWTTVELLLTHSQEYETQFDLGFLLHEALRKKNHHMASLILAKGTNSNWRLARGLNYCYSSSLFYAIQHEFNEFLPQLFAHENGSHDPYSTTRLGLALDLAHVQNNTAAITFFNDNKIFDTCFVWTNIRVSACYYIFEAFFANQPSIAEYRLNRFAKHHDLSLPSNGDSIQALSSFSDVFDITFNYFNELLNLETWHYINAFLDSLLELSFKHNNLLLIKSLSSLLSKYTQLTEKDIDQLVIDSSLKKISANNTELIESMIKASTNIHLWRGMIFHQLREACKDYRLNEKIAPIFYLYLSVCALEEKSITDDILKHVFTHSVKSENVTLTNMILSEIPLTETLKEEFLCIAIGHTRTRYFLYLISHYDFTITEKHITEKFDSDCYWKIVLILHEIKQDQYINKFTPWDFFGIWLKFTTDTRFNKSLELRQLLISLLEPRIVKHFTLLTISILFQKSIFPNTSNFMPFTIPSNLWDLLNNKISTIHVSMQYSINLEAPYIKTLLQYLETYFSTSELLPNDIRVDETYDKVMDILNTSRPTRFKTVFFSRRPRPWENEMYQYLKDINDLIKQNHLNPFDFNTSAAHQNIDDIYADQAINLKNRWH